jgi:hypothetical protein
MACRRQKAVELMADCSITTDDENAQAWNCFYR